MFGSRCIETSSRRNEAQGVLLAAASLLGLALAVPAMGQESPPAYVEAATLAPGDAGAWEQAGLASKEALLQRYPKAAKKLWGKLLPLVDQRERLGQAQAATYASANALPVSEDEVTAIIVPTDGVAPEALAPELTAKGVTVIRFGQGHVKARVPLTSLRSLGEDVAQIAHIQLPIKPNLHVISEGVQAMNADAWHGCGFTGAGVKIAVIDGGFIGLAAAQAAGEIPAGAIEHNETTAGMETVTAHGVGVAEIVYDMAPDCQLYLIKIADNGDLEAAKNYCKTNGIDVINHSMGWYNTNFYDGVAYSSFVPSPVAIADDANANGILWVNSAGNDARRHWRGPWTDANTNGWLDWTTSVEVNQIGYRDGGTLVVLKLTWNAWPTTDQDYDLALFRWTGSTWTLEASSINDQTGTQPPTESIEWPVSQSAYYAAAVAKYSANGTHTFILRSWYQDLQYLTTAGSIGCPADAASVLAVGAIDEDVYATGPTEPYSSLGPNNGSYTGQPSLTKPDVCGPDDTASWTYGSGFTGTSASSPHIAGVAALVLDRFPYYSSAQTRSYIEGETIDLGSPGKDNTYGYGPVVLPADDADGDGVIDPCDLCPGTPACAVVDELGCPFDTDGDGVVDGCDECPDTPPCADPIGPNGCPIDTDEDGVVDGCDDCPDTPACADPIDPNGCPSDSDGDAVVDGCDLCPDTPPCADPVDIDGCPADTDGDGVLDGCDQCPDTPPCADPVDIDGCPSDTDGDAVVDGCDDCPDTPACAHPIDPNGCPSDADADGVADGCDLCPDTPACAYVDEDGCPSDSDADGVVDGCDLCADTPACADPVDELGCPIDTDGDVVVDGCDLCPDTPACADPVDPDGCPSDSDGDGLVDGCDLCPDTPACADPIDADGCAIDTDGDAVVDGCDLCPNTIPGATVDADGCPYPPIPADFDHDGDVDLSDYGEFLSCYNGPEKPPAQGGCDAADFDGDGDVDLTDYGEFLDCYNGPNNPPAC